jgi:oligopeptide transport system permease protein
MAEYVSRLDSVTEQESKNEDTRFSYSKPLNFKLEKASFVGIPAWKESLKHFTANKGAVFGVIFVAIMIFFATVGPYLDGYTFDESIVERQNLPPRIPGIENIGIFNGYKDGVDLYLKQGFKDSYFWFGTDSLGRDIFTRFCEGTRVSLIVAGVCALLNMIFGVTYGLISGYYGGKVDMILQRIIEIINSIPNLVVVTLLLIVLKPGLTTIIVALAISGWIGMSRIVRAQTLKIKESEYVLAARTLGEKPIRILFKEIFPNLFASVIVMGMMTIPEAIFMESFLSFIGLGIPAPQASLGTLINTGYQTMMTSPYQLAIPTFFFALLMISLNLVADGLRDAFDPKQKTV